MSGACAKCCCSACRRGPSPRRSKTRRRLLSTVLRGSVCSDAGQEAWTEFCKPVLSETDRLSATIQTDQEESEIFIRTNQVRDKTR